MNRLSTLTLSFSILAIAAWYPTATNANEKTASHKNTYQLKKNDRIVFLGDSITQAGARPDGFVSLVRNTLNAKKKELGITVIGAGISGHKVPNLEKRLDRDVISKKPTLVIIYIGINDVWHSQSGRGTSEKDYQEGLVRIIKRCRKAGSKVILCTPSMIGEKSDGSNKLDKMLDQYCELSRKVAASEKVQLLDLRRQFVNYLKKHNSQNKARGILTGDGVHLNKKGNQFVADQMLTAIGVSKKPTRLLRHVVLFKFKDGLKKEKVQEVVDAFAALPKKIDAIVDFEMGTDVTAEPLTQGFTHCFVVTFKSIKGRDIYLPHPAHEEFKKLVKPTLEKVLVFDYWTE